MSLEYKTQAYIRKAIRHAEFTQLPSGSWRASLPIFGLEATEGDRNEAEQTLLMRVTAHVVAARLTGKPLPAIDGIDLTINPVEIESHRDPEQAWFWTEGWQAGEREASDDIAAGRVERFDSAEEFLASFPD